MTAPSWEEVSALFHAALDQPDATRTAFVQSRSRHDAALGARVMALLSEHESPDDFLAVPAAALALDEVSEPLPSNGRIGPYKLLREIGRGGMGAVYLADRDDGEYRQQVALKLVKRGMDTDRIVARFRQERQLLAALDHPNIARLLDGGTTADGRPYVVMEHVDGTGIREYCERRSPSIDERLALFRTLCAAVQHAHQNLIVHRDIKAANVLVTAGGVPKLLDFGIARLLDATGAEGATATETLHALTPEYASPEQLLGAPLSTSTDVYSLGVLLYELLTDQRPFATAGRSLAEITRLVRETEPPLPSIVVARRDATLARRLRGDLDTIVLMALHKDPARRYRSVEQLSEDVRRHLDRLPVVAQRDRASYRLMKFVRRNRVGVTAATLASLALLGGTTAALWQARIARTERARSDRRFAEVRSLATSFLFDINDALVTLKGSTPTRALLVKRALESLDGLAKEAPGDPALQRDLAAAYVRVGAVQGNSSTSNLGDTPGALRSYERAVALLDAIPASQARDTSILQVTWQAHEGLANMRNITGDLPAAIQSFGRARDVLRMLAAAAPGSTEHPRMLAMVLRELGETLGADGQASVGDIPGALTNLREAVAIGERLLQRAPSDRRVRISLSTNLMALGSLAVAVGDSLGTTQLARAVGLLERAVAEEPRNVFAREELLSAYSRIRQPWADAARYAEALAIDRKTIALLDAMIANDPQNTLYRRNRGVMLNSLGRDLRAASQAAAAVPYHRAALDVAEQRRAADPQSVENQHDVAVTLEFLGEALADAGLARPALEAFDRAQVASEALQVAEPANPRHGSDLSLIHAGRGRAFGALGAPAPADSALALAVPLAEAAARDTLNTRWQVNLALVYATAGDVLLARSRRHGAGPAHDEECRAAATWHARSVATFRRMQQKGILPARLLPRLAVSEAGSNGCGVTVRRGG
ncbi:MAG: serine/threonine protein kinase [Gemmatimonadaceae bacterium]|nr:serine/threonine protein kinase [Gemmatimonadaceae bacterium]